MKKQHIRIAAYLIATLIIGLFVTLLPTNMAECSIAVSMQVFVQKTIGIQVFQVLTYIGDFYLWVIFASVYFFYSYLKSRKHLDSASELAIFLIVTTALTYLMKIIISRPRPDCSAIAIYEEEDFISSFSYPSGHVSRATGAFLILSRGSRIGELLSVIAISIVSFSRIILGVHYFTDIIGGILLSLAAQEIASITLPFLKKEVEKRRWDTFFRRELSRGT